ncbi:hypothetical protein [Pseudomonas cremoricolorata]|uniref:hypothetical protein n=1 Tax=Pseudomonas cremoricolorata TaxID=157783 RepID=UPI0012E0C16C|nr:hypothetical protein [Pseudomonas cremoricolorata]
MMSNQSRFPGPFLDTYGIGFSLYQMSRNNWKQRTIAGVSWNGQEGKAYFFNPDGIALPLLPSVAKLPNVLREHRTRMQPACVVGSGVFAMPNSSLEALSSSELSQWVTYWFVEDHAVYANCPDTWSAHVELQVTGERKAAEHNYPNVRRINLPTVQTPSPSGQSLQQDTTYVGLAQWVRENTEECRRILQAQYERECAEDQRIADWLRGCTA